jgi:hypothetical protein
MISSKIPARPSREFFQVEQGMCREFWSEGKERLCALVLARAPFVDADRASRAPRARLQERGALAGKPRTSRGASTAGACAAGRCDSAKSSQQGDWRDRVRNTFRKRLATLFPIILASALCGCESSQPGAPYSLAPRLPYAACGDMTTLRANLTGNSDLSPESDAILRHLGVRCIGEGPIVLRARY